MRSLQLIRGTMDQILRLATISAVQSRVLALPQIDGLRHRLDGWSSKVASTGNLTAQKASAELH